MRSKLVTAVAVVALSGSVVSADRVMIQEPAVTVTGCIEKDAAASTAIYKIIVSQPDGGSVIYQLNAPGSSAVPAAVGKTAQVSGAVSIEKRAGREMGFLFVASGPLVRSSYKAGEFFAADTPSTSTAPHCTVPGGSTAIESASS